MTRITNSKDTRAARRALRDSLVEGLMTPYTLLSVVLVLFGVWLVLLDPKGVPILLGILAVVAVIRLLYSIRAELRRLNGRRA